MLNVVLGRPLLVLLLVLCLAACNEPVESDWQMVVYPSANAGRFTVMLIGMTPNEVALQLLDSKGAMLEERQFIGALGQQRVVYDMDDPTAGFYTVVLYADGTPLEHVKVTTVEI